MSVRRRSADNTVQPSCQGALDEFDEATAAYLANVRATEPGSHMLTPPAPWDGLHTSTDSVQRFALVHHVEDP